MRRYVLWGALALATFGCGDDDGAGGDGGTDADTDTDSDTDTDTDTDSDSDTDTDTDTDSDTEAATCDNLADGWNYGWDVGGEAYDFILHLPEGVATDGSGSWAVVFNWHSLGTGADMFDDFISTTYDNETMPFIGVTPDSNGFTIMTMDMTWDVFSVAEGGAGNADVALFDQLVACFETRYGIDENHIHSMGFSLGGIMTDLLATVRGDVLASVGTYSGAYFSDDANVATLGVISGMVSWPDPTHDNMYGQLLCHGGTNDTFDLSVVTVHFDTFGTNDVPYLNTLGHDVIHCVNPDATQHGDLSGLPQPGGFVEFFAAHGLGVEASPWASGLPSSGFSLCTYEAKD
jgi:predicted esterase